MKRFCLMLMAACLLGGCDTIGEMFEPPAMQKPVGVQTPIPPQDTPQREARAAKEREDLPAVPTAPDPETYSNLGTVPPRPALPTPAEIAGQVRELAIEQNNGSAIIAQNANVQEPQLLPKVDGSEAAPDEQTTVQHQQVIAASQDQVSFGNTSPFLPQNQIEQTDRLPADAP